MTQNQIANRVAIETKRHNEAMEAENARHAQRDEELKAWANRINEQSVQNERELKERANAINEAHYERVDEISRLSLAETTRSNFAKEALNAANLQLQSKMADETARANLANEWLKEQQNAINAAAVEETERHSRALEALELNRVNLETKLNDAKVRNVEASSNYVWAQTQTEYQRTENEKAQTALNQSRNVTETYRPAETQMHTDTGYIDTIFKGFDALGKIAVAIGGM